MKSLVLGSLLQLLCTPVWSVTYHALQPGETVVDVARAYYGDNEKAPILLWYNRISDPKKILPGTKIAIPTITRYPVKKGDTLGTLAHQFLGDQRRHKFLAMINHFKSTQALTIGSIIVIPFHIPHVVKKGESLTVIANRYFGDPNKFHLIKSYNFIDDPRAIDPGMEILIPIVDVEVKAGFDPSRHASTSALLALLLYLLFEHDTSDPRLKGKILKPHPEKYIDDLEELYRRLKPHGCFPFYASRIQIRPTAKFLRILELKQGAVTTGDKVVKGLKQGNLFEFVGCSLSTIGSGNPPVEIAVC